MCIWFLSRGQEFVFDTNDYVTDKTAVTDGLKPSSGVANQCRQKRPQSDSTEIYIGTGKADDRSLACTLMSNRPQTMFSRPDSATEENKTV